MKWFMNLPMEVFLYLSKGKSVYTHTNKPIPSSYLLALRHGLNFIPTPKEASKKHYDQEIKKLERRIIIAHQYKNANRDRPASKIYYPSKASNEELAKYYKQPPDEAVNRFLSKLKAHLIQGSASTRRSNLSKEDQNNLTAIKNDPDLFICGTDKNLGPILVSKSLYKEELQTKHLILPTFRKLKNRQAAMSMLGTFRKRVLEIAKPIYSQEEGEANEFKFLKYNVTLKESKFPVPYLLWKVHKNPLATRCIIPSHAYYTSNAAQWLHEKLLPLLSFCETVLPDSNSLIRILDKFQGTSNMQIASKDVTALYPNIPLKAGIEAVSRTIDEYKENHPDEDTFMVKNKKQIIDILRLVLHYNIVEYDGEYLQQIQGTAMGSSIAVIFAQVFMYDLEIKLVREYRNQGFLLLYKRYIDDILSIFTSKEYASKFWATLSKRYASINFTGADYCKTTPFLDLQVSIDGNKITYRPYQKELNNYLYLPYKSFHTLATKRGFIKGELLRFATHSKEARHFRALRALFFTRLCYRGYPAKMLRRIFNQVRFIDREKILYKDPNLGEEKPRRLIFSTYWTPKSNDINLTQFMKENWTPELQDYTGSETPMIAWKTASTIKLNTHSQQKIP